MKTLENRVIISTRPVSSDDNLHDNLIQNGATVLEFPMIEIKCARVDENIKRVLLEIELCDWIIFTSKNGVASFFSLLEKIRCSKEIPSSVKIATIGKTTEEEVRKNGAAPFFVSSGTTSADLLKELSNGQIKFNEIVLLPLGNLAKDILEKGLTSVANPTRINVYETIEAKNVSTEIIDRI
jgi:uroporphyrinogen-III synthase